LVVDSLNALYALGGVSPNQHRSLMKKSFTRERLQEIYLGPGDPPISTVEVSGCSFVSCQVDGLFTISEGVNLHSVVFSEIRAPDGMTIYSASIFNNVIIKGGRKAASLWCKPPSRGDGNEALIEWARRGMADIEVAIDFSELAAPDLEVVGIPTSKLRWNPELHIRVSRSWQESEHWAALELSKRSTWDLSLRRLRQFRCDEGIFSLPVRGDRHYATDMEELARIEEAGILKR